ncbi:MAG: glutathione S-transferase family protein [Spongiibacteraceae bacterium]
MDSDYVLYGTENSYYTGKVRAYMRFKNVNWREQLSTLDVYKSFILPRVGAGIIPVLHTAGDEVLQDTSVIIDFLESRHPEVSVFPLSPKQHMAALLMELYSDEWLLIPAMHYRWNFLAEQGDFIYSEFGRIGAPEGSVEERIEVGKQLGKPFKGVTPMLGVSEQTIPAIESGYMEILAWLQSLFSRQDYLFGSRPSIGDYGLMGPLYAHLGRDPYPKAIMQKHAPAVYAWVERMNKPEPLSGEFLDGDEVPGEVLEILKIQARDQLPFIEKIIAKIEALLSADAAVDVPRFMGMDSFSSHGATGERMITTFSQWMYQRPYNYYHALGSEEKAAVDTLLNELGAGDFFQGKINYPLARKKGQLELVAQA